MVFASKEFAAYNHGMAPAYWKYSWGALPYGVTELPRTDNLDFLPERWVTLERKIWEEFVNAVPSFSELQILDLGCGAGKLVQFFLENDVAAKQIVAIDSSPQLIKWCSTIWENVTFIQVDATKIHLNPTLDHKKFDLVSAHMLFNLLDDDQLTAVLNNAFQKLHDGGVLAIQMPSIKDKTLTHPTLAVKNNETRIRLEDTPWGRTTYYHRSEEKILELLAAAGFEVEQLMDYSYNSFVENTVHLTTALGVDPNRPKRLFLVCRKKISG